MAGTYTEPKIIVENIRRVLQSIEDYRRVTFGNEPARLRQWSIIIDSVLQLKNDIKNAPPQVSPIINELIDNISSSDGKLELLGGVIDDIYSKINEIEIIVSEPTEEVKKEEKSDEDGDSAEADDDNKEQKEGNEPIIEKEIVKEEQPRPSEPIPQESVQQVVGEVERQPDIDDDPLNDTSTTKQDISKTLDELATPIGEEDQPLSASAKGLIDNLKEMTLPIDEELESKGPEIPPSMPVIDDSPRTDIDESPITRRGIFPRANLPRRKGKVKKVQIAKQTYVQIIDWHEFRKKPRDKFFPMGGMGKLFAWYLSYLFKNNPYLKWGGKLYAVFKQIQDASKNTRLAKGLRGFKRAANWVTKTEKFQKYVKSPIVNKVVIPATEKILKPIGGKIIETSSAIGTGIRTLADKNIVTSKLLDGVEWTGRASIKLPKGVYRGGEWISKNILPKVETGTKAVVGIADDSFHGTIFALGPTIATYLAGAGFLSPAMIGVSASSFALGYTQRTLQRRALNPDSVVSNRLKQYHNDVQNYKYQLETTTGREFTDAEAMRQYGGRFRENAQISIDRNWWKRCKNDFRESIVTVGDQRPDAFFRLSSRGPVGASVFNGFMNGAGWMLPGVGVAMAMGVNPALGLAAGFTAGGLNGYLSTRFPNNPVSKSLSSWFLGGAVGASMAALMGLPVAAGAAVGSISYGSLKYIDNYFAINEKIGRWAERSWQSSMLKGVHGIGIGAMLGAFLAPVLGQSILAGVLVGGASVGALRFINNRFATKVGIKGGAWGGIGALLGAIGSSMLGLSGTAALAMTAGGAALGATAGAIHAKFFAEKTAGRFALGHAVASAGLTALGMYNAGSWFDMLRQRYKESGESLPEFMVHNFNPTTTNGLINTLYLGAGVSDVWTVNTLGQRLGAEALQRVVAEQIARGTASKALQFELKNQIGLEITKRAAEVPTAMTASEMAAVESTALGNTAKALAGPIGWGALIGTIVGGFVGAIAFGGAPGAMAGAMVGASIGATAGALAGFVAGATYAGAGFSWSGPGAIAAALVGGIAGGVVGALGGGIIGKTLTKAVDDAKSGISAGLSVMKLGMTLGSIDWKKINSLETLLALVFSIISMLQLQKNYSLQADIKTPDKSSGGGSEINQLITEVDTDVTYAAGEPMINSEISSSYIVDESYVKSPNATAINAKKITDNLDKGFWGFYNHLNNNTNWDSNEYSNWQDCINKNAVTNCSTSLKLTSKSLYWGTQLIIDTYLESGLQISDRYTLPDDMLDAFIESNKYIQINTEFNFLDVEPGYIVFLSDQNPYENSTQNATDVGIVYSIEKDYITVLRANEERTEYIFPISFDSSTGYQFFNEEYIIGFGYSKPIK